MRLFSTEILQGSATTLKEVGPEVVTVHNEVTQSLLSTSKPRHVDSITRELQNPETYFVLLRLNATRQLVGFSHVAPNIGGLHEEDVDDWLKRSRTKQEREAIWR